MEQQRSIALNQNNYEILTDIINEKRFKQSLCAESFFKEIMIYFYEKKLLDESELSRINIERMKELKIHLKYYTKDESSSVMEEDAEKILKGIDYSVSIYLKNVLENEKNKSKLETVLLNQLKNEELAHMHKQGFEIIKKKRGLCKQLLLKIQKNKLKVEHYAYNDTIDRGLGIFFKSYDDFFVPQENQGSIDYPLYIDDMKYSGIEYMQYYLNILDIENDFCRKFDIDEVKMVLQGYDRESEMLLINIFEIVLTNALGKIICGKNPENLNITDNERKSIKIKLEDMTRDELTEFMIQCSEKLIEILGIYDEKLKDYIKCSIYKISINICNGIKTDKLERIFVSYRNNDDELIKYVDKEKMSNSAFRNLAEKINESSCIEAKIDLIKNSIKSFGDLIDIMEADCIFENEFNIFFTNLPEVQTILLCRHMSDFDLWNNSEKKWQEEFKRYMLSLDKQKFNQIFSMAEKVNII